MATNEVRLPVPDLQIGFASLLAEAGEAFLQPALLRAVSILPLAQIDAELHALDASPALAKLARAACAANSCFRCPWC